MTVEKLTQGEKNPSTYILMVSNVYLPVVGGISTYIRDLCSALSNDGTQVRILAFPPKLSRLPRFVRWFFYLGFILHVFSVACALRLRGRSLIVHSHSASFCLAAATLCSRFLNCRSLHTFHSPMERPSSALNYFVPKVGAVAYVAEATRQLYRSHGVPAHPCEILIAGGVDVDYFQPPVRRPSEDDSILRILFVGRICQEKGVREAIQAMTEMQCFARLLIVGVAQNPEQKAYEKDLRNMVQESQILTERVIFCGALSGKPLLDVFQSADFFVVPSLWEEPAPMVIAEAFASGLPVVAFDSGGLRERVHDGSDGLIVPRGDITGLAAAFDQLINKEEERFAMGTMARKRAVGEFSVAAMLEKYRKIYAR